MSHAIGTQPSKVHGAGEIVRSESKPPVFEFDDQQIADPRLDEEIEGGKTLTRTTGVTGLSDSQADKGIVLLAKEQDDPKFEIGGFKVEYNHPESGDIISGDVRRYFANMAEVEKAFKDGKYIQEEIIMTITEGVPEVYCSEIMKYKYIDSEFVRA